MSNDRQIGLGDVPDAIRRAVVAEARERDISFSKLVSEIVARCLGVQIAPTGQRLRRSANGELRVVRIPTELSDALERVVTGDRRVAKARLILNCLAEHYGLPSESPLNRSLAQPRDQGGRFVGRS